MSSSDYTALRKYKEMQANIETITNADGPLPTPFGCNPQVTTISTGVNGHPGPTGPIGPTGRVGPTGAHGPTNGGVFALYAYAGNFDYITNSGYIFSFGNSAFTNITSYGFPINIACTLSNVGVKVLNPPPVPWTIQVYRSGNVANSVTIATVDNGVRDKFVDNLNLAFSPGDYITIRCLAGQGGDAINVSLWFRTDGVVGPAGPTGQQGPIGSQGVTGPAGASWAVGILNTDLVFNAKLGAVGDVSFNSNLYLHGNGYFNNNLSIGDDLTVNNNLYVLNDASINKLFVNNNANFNSKLIANKDASFNSKLTVANDAVMNSKLIVSGNTTLNSNLLVANNTTINVGLKVLGDVSFNNELFVDGKALFQDKVIINNDLYVLNDTSLNSTLYVANDVTLNSKLSVANDVSLNSKLMVANDVSLNSKLTVAKDTTLNSKLFVIGDSSLNAKLYVGGVAIIEQTLNVNDNTYLNAMLMVTDDALLNKKLIVMDNAILNSKLLVDGDALLDSNLIVAKDVSFNSKLFVRGDVSMDSVLIVANDVSLNSKLSVRSDVSLNSKLLVAGDVSLNSKLAVANNVSLNSKLLVFGDVSLNSKLAVAGDVYLNSKLAVAGDLSLNSKLAVANDVSLNSKLLVAGDVSLNSKLAVAGDVSLNSKLAVANDVYLNSKLAVAGDLSLNSKLAVANDVSLNSKLLVAGDVSLNSKLAVAGDVSLNSKLAVAGDVSFNSKLLVFGDVSLNSKLAVAGDVSLNSKLVVAGDVSFNSKLLVFGDVSLNSTLYVADDTYIAANLGVSADVIIYNTLTVDDNTYLNLNLTVQQNANIQNNLLVMKNTTLNNTLYVDNDTTLDSKLFVHGDVSMASALTVAKDVSLNSKLYVRGDVSMDSILAVAKDVSLNSKLYVRGDVSMDSILMVAKDVSLNSKLYVRGDVSMDSILAVAKDVSLNRNLYVRGDVSMDSILAVAKDVSLNSKLYVRGDVSMDSILAVAKDVALNSKLYVRGDVSMDSILAVAKDVSLNSKLFVRGDVSMDSILAVAKDVSFNSKLFVKGDASFNGRVDICGNLYAQYPNTSIPKSAINGPLGLPLTFGTIFGTDISSTKFGDISAVYFDTDAGFDVTALSAGEIKVSMNSTFKYWDLSGQVPVDASNASTTGLVARGLDTMNFVEGNNIQFGLFTTGSGNDTTNYFKISASVPDYSSTTLVAGNGINVTGGDVSFSNHLSVGGDVSFNRNLDISGDLTVRGNLSVYRQESTSIINTTVNNYQVIITKDISLNGNLAVANDVSLNHNLYLKGDASFNGRVDICGNLYAQYPPSSIPRSAIRNELGGSDVIVNNSSQSFYDIITQQPQTFTKNASYTDGYVNTTRSIKAYWTYDDILAKMPNSSEFAFLNFDTSYKKTLPNIDNVYIDVSSGSITNGWARYNTLNITSDYNTNAYKSVTITRKQISPSGNSAVTTLLAATPLVNFDLRVYGENSGANYPTVEVRSLIYRQIAFKEAKAPGQPLFVSKAINSFDQLTLTYNFTYPEIGDTESLGFLSESQTKYTQSDTLSSTAYPVVQTIVTDNETDDNVAGGSNFTVVLTGLRAGTKYNFLTRVQNDLSPLYSILDSSWNNVPSAQVPYDSNGPTQYTTIPSSGAYTTTGPSTLTYANTNNITTSTISNTNVIYVNIGNSDTISPTNSTEQSFQITNPSAASTDTFGYGKWIDNSTNLVQVKAFVDDSQKQVLSYNGFTPSAGTKAGAATIGTSSTGVNYFGTPTQSDIYSGNSQTQGFRLYGTIQLLPIATANIQAAIGQARSTPYQLKLEVTRDIAKVGGTATVSATSNIYVDNLSLNPTLTSTNSPTVVSVVWTMGIPSVKKYKIDCARTYNNINSTTGFIRGDRKLSDFTGITTSSNTASASSGFTTGTISIAQNAIQSNGTYIYDAAAFSSGTSNALQSLHYTSAILNPSTTLTVSETAYSLKTGNSGVANNTTVLVSHHFDMSSYTGYGNSLSTRLSVTDIYEITDATISKLNNDIGGLGVAAYTDHTVIIKAWTLLYYSGKFQTNSTVTYPNVTSYAWNGLSGSYTYNAGVNGLDLTGAQVSSGTRYKWIVFKLNKLSNTQYSFNGTTYNVLANNESNKYLSVKAMLSDTGLFNSATVSALFNDANTDAIGFCRATKAGTSVNVIGNFKQVFDPLSGTWSTHGTETTGYTNSLSSSYGSKITNSNGDFGIYLNPTSINNDLYLFIGLKI